jgi:hypothetical protein
MFTAAAYLLPKRVTKNALVNDISNEAKNWGAFEVNNRVGAAGQL